VWDNNDFLSMYLKNKNKPEIKLKISNIIRNIYENIKNDKYENIKIRIWKGENKNKNMKRRI